MKLPENKNERIKILAMIGIGILAVLYAILQLAVMPILDSNKSNLKMLEDKREEQKKAKLDPKEKRKLKREKKAKAEELSKQAAAGSESAKKKLKKLEKKIK